MDQGICGFPWRLSHEAFPRGFPTGLSHEPPWCESILGLKIEAVQGKQLSLKWTAHLGDSGNGGTTLEFLSPFLWRAPPLELRREHREFFPDHAVKGSLPRARRQRRVYSGCGPDSRASSRVETGKSGNFLSCSKVVKDPLEIPEVRFDKPRGASAEMGLISPGGENLLDFLELRQELSTYDGDLRDPLWWPQERAVPMRVARVPLRIPLPLMLGPKTLCGVGART